MVDFKYIVGQLSLIHVAYDLLRFSFRLHGSGITRPICASATDDRVVESEVLALPLARDGATIDMLLVGVIFFA